MDKDEFRNEFCICDALSLEWILTFYLMVRFFSVFRRGFWVAAGSILFVSGLGASAPIELSLGELFMRVESENLEVLLNRETVEQAVVAAQRARASLLPRIDLETSQVRSQFVNIGRGFEIPGLPGGIPSVGPSNRFDARLTGSISLVDPVLIASFRAAKVGIEVSEFEQQRILQEVLDSAAMVYLTHLRNLKRFEVIESDIERDRALLELTVRQREAGVVTRIDVTRAEVQLAAARQAHLQQETVVLESELFLKRFLNLDLHAPLKLAEFSANRFLPVEGQPLEVETVLEDLPDYLRAQAQLDRNRLERKAAAWERFPVLRLFGDYGYVSAEAFDGNEERAWMVGVSATLPIFEGFQIRANKDLADSRIRATEVELERIEQEASTDLLLAWQDLKSRLAQIELAELNVELSDEELRLARSRFEEGAADNRELIEAQNRIAVAHDNLVEAIFRYNLSRLEYARSKGDVRLLLADQQVGDN